MRTERETIIRLVETSRREMALCEYYVQYFNLSTLCTMCVREKEKYVLTA